MTNTSMTSKRKHLGRLKVYFSSHKMKTHLPRLLVAGMMLIIGYKPLMQSNLLSFGSKDNYEVQWNGVTGNKLFGSYGIASKNASAPSQVEKITGILPYKVKFSAPKNVLISAAGTTLNQGAVEIKIYKNGSECGQPTLIGSGAMANKTCH